MWWECSECGGRLERTRPPVVCRECGTAGVIFVPAEHELDEPNAETLTEAWVQAGIALARSSRNRSLVTS